MYMLYFWVLINYYFRLLTTESVTINGWLLSSEFSCLGIVTSYAYYYWYRLYKSFVKKKKIIFEWLEKYKHIDGKKANKWCNTDYEIGVITDDKRRMNYTICNSIITLLSFDLTLNSILFFHFWELHHFVFTPYIIIIHRYNIRLGYVRLNREI